MRNASATWRETRNALHKDQRWRLAKLLAVEEKERLFEEHMSVMTRKSREMFHRLLADTPAVTLATTWKDVKRIIRADTRFAKISSHDRVCESSHHVIGYVRGLIT